MTIAQRISRSLRAIIWRRHARQEAENDKVSASALEDELRRSFTLVEHYPEDPQGESALVLVFVGAKAVHVVISPQEDFCYLITVYVPDLERWDETFTRRRI
jgi:hypothetical protein